ncbi:MAG: hypothetical protein RLZZ450_572 [Pseudomonadota bacterium]
MQLDLFARDASGPDDDENDEFAAARRDAGRRPSVAPGEVTASGEVAEPRDAGSLFLPTPADAHVAARDLHDDGGAPAVKLILRYDFAGSGTELVDRVSGKRARALGGAKLDGSGLLALDGVDDYVDLPEGTLSTLDSVTVVTWLALHQGSCRQPVFGFGERESTPDATYDDAEHAALSVSLSSCPAGDAGVEPPPASVTSGTFSIRHDRVFQLALSYDAKRLQKTLYVNGVRVSEGPIHYALSDLNGRAWLGRVRWKQDYFARSSYDEFRVYDGVLTESQIVSTYTRGPDRP